MLLLGVPGVHEVELYLCQGILWLLIYCWVNPASVVEIMLMTTAVLSPYIDNMDTIEEEETYCMATSSKSKASTFTPLLLLSLSQIIKWGIIIY